MSCQLAYMSMACDELRAQLHGRRCCRRMLLLNPGPSGAGVARAQRFLLMYLPCLSVHRYNWKPVWRGASAGLTSSATSRFAWRAPGAASAAGAPSWRWRRNGHLITSHLCLSKELPRRLVALGRPHTPTFKHQEPPHLPSPSKAAPGPAMSRVDRMQEALEALQRAHAFAAAPALDADPNAAVFTTLSDLVVSSSCVITRRIDSNSSERNMMSMPSRDIRNEHKRTHCHSRIAAAAAAALAKHAALHLCSLFFCKLNRVHLRSLIPQPPFFPLLLLPDPRSPIAPRSLPAPPVCAMFLLPIGAMPAMVLSAMRVKPREGSYCYSKDVPPRTTGSTAVSTLTGGGRVASTWSSPSSAPCPRATPSMCRWTGTLASSSRVRKPGCARSRRAAQLLECIDCRRHLQSAAAPAALHRCPFAACQAVERAAGKRQARASVVQCEQQQPQQHRRLGLAELRSGVHWGAEERERLLGPARRPRDQRYCMHCAAAGLGGRAEDADHIVFECVLYAHLRPI